MNLCEFCEQQQSYVADCLSFFSNFMLTFEISRLFQKLTHVFFLQVSQIFTAAGEAFTKLSELTMEINPNVEAPPG